MIVLVPSIVWLKSADELLAFMLLGVALLDSVVNRNFHRYKLLWIICGIMAFYTAYSLLFLSYNNAGAIFQDAIIEIKPYLPFAVFIALKPALLKSEKQILSGVALANASAVAIIGIVGISGYKPIINIIGHVAFIGIVMIVSIMVYLFCNIDSEGRIPKKKMIVALLFLILGLTCTRSKYYGEFILYLFFFYVYKRGMLSSLNIKHIVVLILLGGVILGATWQKLNYYFIYGSQTTLATSETLSEAARPALYAGAGMILVDHFPLGTGLASYASYASGESYSGVYEEYGLNQVYGLTEDSPDFICDAFYPSLAQFGFVGVGIFIAFWVYLYRFLVRYVRRGLPEDMNKFKIGSLIVCFILIESIAGTVFTSTAGMMAMMLFGIVAGEAPEKVKEQKESLTLQTEPKLI